MSHNNTFYVNLLYTTGKIHLQQASKTFQVMPSSLQIPIKFVQTLSQKLVSLFTFGHVNNINA